MSTGEHGGHPETSGRTRILLTWGISLAAGAVLLALVSRRLEVIPTSLHLPRPDLLAWAVGLQLPYAVLRAHRLRFVLDPAVRRASAGDLPGIPGAALYGSGWLSFAVIMLLPLRLGELSRPLLLQRQGLPGVDFPVALAAVATERVVDGLAVVGLLFAGLALSDAAIPGTAAVAEVRAVGQAMAAVFVAGLVGVVLAAWAPQRVIASLGLGGRAAAVVTEVAAALRPLGRPRQGIPFLIGTAAYWAVTVLQLALVAAACGLELGVAAAAAVVASVGLSIQLPGGPAQAGSFQLGALAGLSLFVDTAAPTSAASVASFSALMYLLSLGGTLIFALPGIALLRPSRRPRGPQRSAAAVGDPPVEGS